MGKWNPVKDVTRAAQGVVHIVDRGANDVGKSINRAAIGLGHNIEGNIGDNLKGIAMMIGGKWDGFGRTLLDSALMYGSLGMTSMLNQNNINHVTDSQTAYDKAVSKAQNDADVAVQQQAADATAAREQAVANLISGIMGSYQRSPGRAATLLANQSGSPQSNTLLTYIRGK
jgi:hypothetical protein